MGLSDVFLLGDEVEDELLEGEDDSWAPLTDSDAENEDPDVLAMLAGNGLVNHFHLAHFHLLMLETQGLLANQGSQLWFCQEW